ncbi:MAG: methyl-accepting chemotaxis protein [Ignisphaera sp.]
MKPNLRTIASTTIAILFLIPLILSIAPIQAQFVAATITSVSSPAYPGEPVTITINVALATTVNVYLCADSGCSTIWASTWFAPPTPGQYTVSLTLPLSLPNAAFNATDGMLNLYVVVQALGVSQSRRVPIAPKVVVSPIQTSNVDAFGNPVTATVSFYGYAPGDTITQIQFKGPITVSYTTSLSVASDGTASTTVNLVTLTGKGLPRGTYTVAGIATQTNVRLAKNGTLTIVPQVVIKPKEGNGRCDGSVCELQNINITGYGFDPNVNILKIDLWNINFTNVRYTFTKSGGLTTTDGYGYFTLSNLAQYLKTNMTAGLYVPIVYEAPLPQKLSNTSSIALGSKGAVVISQSAIYNALGTRASITATSYVSGTLAYLRQTTAMSYTKSDVLRINITYAGKKYMLAANLETGGVRFSLYNTTPATPIQMFTGVATIAYNSYYNAYTANVSFNIYPTSYVLAAPTTPGQYTYWATFYNYSNYIFLELKQWGLSISAANLTITYTNADTGTTIKKFYVYPTNMSLSATTVVSIASLSFSDAGISWTVSWSYNASAQRACLTVVGQPTTGPSFTFRNVYYIVRPLLVLLTPGIIKPGDTVAIAAYGYGPGSAWGYPGYNTLNVYWEKIRLLATVPLGKDGNATFKVTIPSDATFGVHYIWGVDKWEYEYTLAIVIGAKAYWTIVYPPPFTPPAKLSPVVSAGYNNQRIVACPCPETVVGLSYCNKCVAYGGRCDYLGDIIRITLSGLSPGETVTIYFGTTQVKSVVANASTATIDFVVPTVPQGTYQLVAVGSVSGTIYVTMFYNGTAFLGSDASPVYPQVVPKLLLLDLNKSIVPILVGQGIVRVIGTGFPPGASVLAMLINNTDAGYSMNLQVQRWGSNSNGVLINTLSPQITPGIYVPVLEPGAYAFSLLYVLPSSTQPSSTMPGYVYVVNNVSRLVDKSYFNNAVSSLSKQISAVNSSIKALSSAVSDVKTTLTAVSSTLQQLSSAVASGFDSISKKIDSAQSAITNVMASATSALSSKIDAVNSNVNAVSSKVDTLSSKVDSVSKAVSNVSSKVSTLDSAISKLQDAINSVNSAVQQLTGLSSKVDSISSAISTLNSKVDSLTGAVNSVSSKVDNVASKVDNAANSLSSAINGVSSKVDAVSGKVDTVSGKVDAVSSKIDTVSSNLSNLSGKIDSATSTLQTYIIITLVLALIAAATSIYAAIQLGRKLAA